MIKLKTLKSRIKTLFAKLFRPVEKLLISHTRPTAGKCMCVCMCMCVCLSVCLDVNQGGTNRNRCTQRLVVLHTQTY